MVDPHTGRLCGRTLKRSNEGTGTDKKAQGSRPTPSDLRLFLIRHPPIGGRAKASDRCVREVCSVIVCVIGRGPDDPPHRRSES